jgi:F420-dependent oxidoreductase-like protein
MPIIRSGTASFTGETISGHAGIDVRGSSPFPVLLAALGTKMLELAGGVADGTVTWMTGPATIESHIVPTITSAAATADKPAPRIGVSLPVCVTNDADAARERAAKIFKVYGTLPSYRAMLDKEGADGPADVAIAGDEDTVRSQIEHLASIGTTDFVANVFGSSGERERTTALLRSLL